MVHAKGFKSLEIASQSQNVTADRGVKCVQLLKSANYKKKMLA